MEGKKDKDRYWWVALLVVSWLLVLSLLVGCRSSKQVQGQKVQMVKGVEINLDSTSHRYIVNRVTLYDAGKVSRVEEVESHALEQVVKVVRDTMYLHSTDTLYIERDATPSAQVAKSISTTAKFVVCLVLLVVAIAGYIWLEGRIRKLP